MPTLLLPCDGSSHCLLAVRHVLAADREGQVQRIHLVNVQPPFSAYIARHVDRATRMDFHREQADAALAGAREILDAAGVTYEVHREIGERARCIARLAERLHCDRIVLGTRRRSGLARLIGNSLTSRLLDHSTVPVEVITVHRPGLLERAGVPAMCHR